MPELIPAAPGSPDWLAARRTGVTATDIVTILGLSSWSSPYSLYWQKMGQVPEPEDNDRFRLGRELESYVIRRWGEASPGQFISAGGLYQHAERGWQLATLDARVTHNGLGYEPLEVKTWADADKPAWQDGPPPAVRAQVLWQMDVMGVVAGHVGVVFLPSGEFRSYIVEHGPRCAMDSSAQYQDCPACGDTELMRQAGEEFMRRLRLELPAPDPDVSAATLAAVKARFARQPDKTAEVDPDLYQLWLDHKHAADEIAALARGAESRLREQAGEASVLTVDGQPVARRIVSDAQVKAHVRHSDYLRRIKQEENPDE